jgi:hypothetical protein
MLREYATMLYYVYIAYLVTAAALSPVSILRWVLLVHTHISLVPWHNHEMTVTSQ